MKKIKYLVVNGCSFSEGACMYPNLKEIQDKHDNLLADIEEDDGETSK